MYLGSKSEDRCSVGNHSKPIFTNNGGPGFITVKGIDREYVNMIMETALEMKYLVKNKGGDDSLKHRILGSIFFEPSTRTSCSFQAAMLRLGGSVITLDDISSSSKKGESLTDTIQTMSCYCDAIVLRHPLVGSAKMAAAVSQIPVINAGDGTGEHPTQAMLDLFTIQSELGMLKGSNRDSKLVITFIGDLKNGRAVHSLVELLLLFQDIRIIYVSSPGLEIPECIVEAALKAGVEQTFAENLQGVIGETDVLYVTRIQKERFESHEEYEKTLGYYCIDSSLMKLAKSKMIVMHPLPRVGEIHTEVDKDPRAAYFRQMENGMFVRMALLKAIILYTEK